MLSPWERMHTAYLSNCASVGPDEPEELEREELEPEGALGLVVAVLVLPSLATALCAGVAPQAATRKLKDASTAAMTTGRVVSSVTRIVSADLRQLEPIALVPCIIW